jgi:RNA polymerase sigma-70 factor (ECF subfamily)
MSSPHDEEFRRLMERVRAGSHDAARELYDRYSDAIRRVVRRRLHQRLRPHYDSLDFLQDVWASFFVAPEEVFTFEDPDSLIRCLAGIAYRKVALAFRRRFQTAKRDVNREQPLDGGRAADPPTRGPTPSQVAMANERWERLLAGQSESCRVMLEMLRQGHSHTEIAARTGLHPKMIQRLLHKMSQRQGLS